MGWIKERLTYANVVSTLALFLVLAGGAAWAARVPQKSVGPRQLKANAVTTAKIKANAVTTRKIRRNAVRTGKIRDGAVEGAKIADGTVGLADLDQSSLPFARVVHRARGGSLLEVIAEPKAYPLDVPFYVQPPGESDSYLGAMNVAFSPECEAPRTATAKLLVDSPDPTKPDAADVVAQGVAEDEGEGVGLRRIELGAYGGFAPTRLESTIPRVRKLSLVAYGSCTGGSGITATFGAADVIGVR